MKSKEFVRWLKDFLVDVEFNDTMEKKIRERFEALQGEPEILKVLVRADQNKLDWYEKRLTSLRRQVEHMKQSILIKEVIKYVETDKFFDKAMEIDVEPPLDAIAQSVCERHGITLEQLRVNSPKECYEKGERRCRRYVNARKAFVLQAKAIYPYTLKKLARFLECHHSTVIHMLHEATNIMRA